MGLTRTQDSRPVERIVRRSAYRCLIVDTV